MRRRDFITSASLGGYSLVVLAQPGQQPSVPPLSTAGPRDFETIAPSRGQRRSLPVEPNMSLVELETDVLVAGGGLAGVCAAISAARHGAKVVLIQDRSRLGGNSSSEVKMHVVGSNAHKSRPGWREGGLLEEIRLDDAANNPQRCWEMWDLLLYDKVVSEPNITLLMETVLYSVKKNGDRIEHVMARCDKSEHLYRIKAQYFCDATGDSRLGLEAGAELRSGREAKSEFDESLAPEKADGETLGSSILFTSRHYDDVIPFTPPKWARKVTADMLRMRKVNSWEYGYWWIEWGGHLNTIRDNERIRFELLSIVMGVWDYIKNSGDHPSSAKWGLDWVGMMPGKRGSRRLVGDYMLRQKDLMEGDFADAIAIGGWPMDDHPPGGFDRADLPPAVQIRTPEVFNIPLRSLYSRNIRNLFMAGRNISATHVAFTSTRVMGTCAVVGQATGTAIAKCLKEGVTPKQLAKNAEKVKELQQALLRDDQSIRGLKNEDPLDLARQAKVTACAGDDPAIILNGFTRDIPGKTPQINHWSAPLEKDGAWIELSWDKPQKLGHIQLTFDSGFKRELTLSSSAAANRGIIRAPQPETVRDYTVYYRTKPDGELVKLAEVKKNHQRLNRHKFAAVDAQSIRIHIHATNGDEQARIFEVRCYA